MKCSEKNEFIKERCWFPLLSFEGGPGVSLLNFERDPDVPLLGGSQVFGSGGPEVPCPWILVPLLHHTYVGDQLSVLF